MGRKVHHQTAELLFCFGLTAPPLCWSFVHKEIPDRALNCEDWQECEFNNGQLWCKEGLCGVQRGGAAMLAASYPPLMDPVMNRTSEGFRDGRVAHLLKLEYASRSSARFWQSATFFSLSLQVNDAAVGRDIYFRFPALHTEMHKKKQINPHSDLSWCFASFLFCNQHAFFFYITF